MRVHTDSFPSPPELTKLPPHFANVGFALPVLPITRIYIRRLSLDGKFRRIVKTCCFFFSFYWEGRDFRSYILTINFLNRGITKLMKFSNLCAFASFFTRNKSLVSFFHCLFGIASLLSYFIIVGQLEKRATSAGMEEFTKAHRPRRIGYKIVETSRENDILYKEGRP